MEQTDIKSIIENSFNQYELIKFLGEGAFAKVYLLNHKFLEEKRAIKIVKEELNQNNNVQKVFHEARVATQLRNKNIINIYDAGIIKNISNNFSDNEKYSITNKQWAYFILEYVNGGDLENYRKSFINSNIQIPLKLVLNIIKQITEGLDTLHSSNPIIIHRDLKTKNILLTFDKNGKILIKISDFGFATELTTSKENLDIGGTKPYMAPECFDKIFTTQTDIYAVGVIFYLLLTDHFPYDITRFDTNELINKKAWQNKLINPSEYNPEIPKNVEVIVKKCLEIKSTNRYSNANELLEALNDCIITTQLKESHNIDNNEDLNKYHYTSDNIKRILKIAKEENKLNEAIELLEKELLVDFEANKIYASRLELWKSDNPDIKLIMRAFQITLRGKNYKLACELLQEAFAYKPENKKEYDGYLYLWQILDKLAKDKNIIEAINSLEELTRINKKIYEEYNTIISILKTYQVNTILEESLKLKEEGKLEDAAKLLEFIVVYDKRIENEYSYKLSLWKQNLEI